MPFRIVRVSKDARLQNEELRRYQNKKDESDEHLPNSRHARGNEKIKRNEEQGIENGKHGERPHTSQCQLG